MLHYSNNGTYDCIDQHRPIMVLIQPQEKRGRLWLVVGWGSMLFGSPDTASCFVFSLW